MTCDSITDRSGGKVGWFTKNVFVDRVYFSDVMKQSSCFHFRDPSVTTKPVILTRPEQDLLKQWSWFYEALASGLREPRTEAQHHFVEVSHGRAVPETDHEIAYAKSMRRSAEQRGESEGSSV